MEPRAKAAREGLGYCLLGSAGRDGSVGRDGDDGAGREGGGWREGSGSRAVIWLLPSALVLAVNRRLAEQLSVHEISRSPEVCYGGLAPMEARERSPVA